MGANDMMPRVAIGSSDVERQGDCSGVVDQLIDPSTPWTNWHRPTVHKNRSASEKRAQPVSLFVTFVLDTDTNNEESVTGPRGGSFERSGTGIAFGQ